MIKIVADIHYQDGKGRPCFRRSVKFFEDQDLEQAIGHVMAHAHSPKLVWEYQEGPIPKAKQPRTRGA